MPVLMLMCSAAKAVQLPCPRPSHRAKGGTGHSEVLNHYQSASKSHANVLQNLVVQVLTLARSSLTPLCMRVMALWSSGASLAAFLYSSARRPGISSVSALDEMWGVHRVVSKGQLTG